MKRAPVAVWSSLLLAVLASPPPKATAADSPAEEWRIKGALAALEDGDPAVHLLAVNALSELKATRAAEQIAKFLHDPAAQLRRAAAVALGALGAQDPAAVRPFAEDLARLLKDGDPGVRSAAAAALGALGDAGQAQHLVRLLEDKDYSVRLAAAAALGVLATKNPAAVRPFAEDLARLLKDDVPGVRSAAAVALGALGDIDQAPHLVRLLGDKFGSVQKDSSVRDAAVEALGVLAAKNPAAVGKLAEAVARLLKDGDQFTRSGAAAALGALGDVDQAPHLVRLLEDDEYWVRHAAVEALGVLAAKNPAAVGKLAEAVARLLKDGDQFTWSAAEALGALGDVDQAPLLVPLLKDKEASVRAAAARALGALAAKNAAAVRKFAKDLALLLKNEDLPCRQAAAKSLAALGDVDQAPLLVPLLEEQNIGDRDAAEEALRALAAKNPAAVGKLAEAVARLLENEDSDVRSAAAKALGALGDVDQAPLLVPLLKDKEASVRAAAVEALGVLATKDPAAVQKYAGDVARLLDDKHPFVLDAPEPIVRTHAALALGALGDAGQAWRLVALLKDKDSFVRAAAVEALGVLAAKDPAAVQKYAGEVVPLLKDGDLIFRSDAAKALGALGDGYQTPLLLRLRHIVRNLAPGVTEVRSHAATALIGLGQQPPPVIAKMLCLPYDDPLDAAELRWLAYYLSGGDPKAILLIRWLGRPAKTLEPPRDRITALAALETFEDAWDNSDPTPLLKNDLGQSIAKVIDSRDDWQESDLDALRRLHQKLAAAYPIEAGAVAKKVASLEWWRAAWQWFRGIIWVVVGHAAFWAALILFYPRNPTIQAIFFWNPWVRRVFGFAYVGLLLTWVPFLRTRLFAPFRESLLADAALDRFQEQNYFQDVEVKRKPSERIRLAYEPGKPIAEAVPGLRGQVVLEGESGLGKSMFLRHLLSDSRRLAVYLPAARCTEGVLPPIRKKLHGKAGDARFLRDLIYSGALDVYIDGLNEVSPETRAKINDFAENYFKGNIILATQPLPDWREPATASVYVFQPLAEDKFAAFLSSRRQPSDAAVKGDEYQDAVERFVKSALRANQRKAAREWSLKVLSNPLDLTVVADMLARKEKPDLYRLRQQQYELMAPEYKADNQGRDFPLTRFSEAAYELRLRDEARLPEDKFRNELLALEKHKMVVRRVEDVGGQSRTVWLFAHEKIADFFVARVFLGEQCDKPTKHLHDPRFRGVYFLLAQLLPRPAAKELLGVLILDAARTQDHAVSDQFVLHLDELTEAESAKDDQPDAFDTAQKNFDIVLK